jgi:hypothetical protein
LNKKKSKKLKGWLPVGRATPDHLLGWMRFVGGPQPPPWARTGSHPFIYLYFIFYIFYY